MPTEIEEAVANQDAPRRGRGEGAGDSGTSCRGRGEGDQRQGEQRQWKQDAMGWWRWTNICGERRGDSAWAWVLVEEAQDPSPRTARGIQRYAMQEAWRLATAPSAHSSALSSALAGAAPPPGAGAPSAAVEAEKPTGG